ncbi:HK [Acanthosepion pharaonis]|uniref:Phosphotransferase n=1 Tax=Acanthosepion pharaonis TaxID=158019 RepID=A0A812C310_ACAPH|nr:HK [Sepia pharaonis]
MEVKKPYPKSVLKNMSLTMEDRAEKLHNLFSKEHLNQIKSIFSMFVLSEMQIKAISAICEQNMQYGSSRDVEIRKKTTLLMENTFIRRNLSGNENGIYLGLDLGGTNFRVVRMKFVEGTANTVLKYYKIPDECFTGPCHLVFEYMADCIEDFLKYDNLENEKNIPLGFTFSFPSEKKNLTHNLPVKLVAIISDTTAALITGNFLDKKCTIGLILGTGSNVCYIENVDSIEKWEDDNDCSKQVMINVEWGGLSDTGCLDFLRNKYDYNVDKLSNHINSFTFEKLFSGLYLGEVVRQILTDMTKLGILFNKNGSQKLFTPWRFQTMYVADIESDTDEDFTNTSNILKELDLLQLSQKADLMLVKEVCALVSQRGAYIVAAALSALVDRTKREVVTIAVDGSLYENHPKYHSYMMDVIHALSPQTKTNIILAKDSSGQGSAIAAALVTQKS